MIDDLPHRVARRYQAASDDPSMSELEADIQSRSLSKDPSFKIDGSWKKYLFDMQGYSIFAVDGEWVRTNLSVIFGHGGHGCVHEFIPMNEIWVSTHHWDENGYSSCGHGAREVSREYFLSCILHEITECERMKQGEPFSSSHEKSLMVEEKLGLLEDPDGDSGSTPLKLANTLIGRVVSRYKEVMSFKYEPKETKQHKAERVGDNIREATGLQKGVSLAIADAFVRGRDVNLLATPKDWPIERGVITGPKGKMQVSELSSLL